MTSAMPDELSQPYERRAQQLRLVDVWVIPGLLLVALAVLVLAVGVEPYAPLAGALAIRVVTHALIQKYWSPRAGFDGKRR